MNKAASTIPVSVFRWAEFLDVMGKRLRAKHCITGYVRYPEYTQLIFKGGIALIALPDQRMQSLLT